MTNKTTKRALFTSFMALLLCCSMLVGTTFAWFTDSVTSANNIIISGNLDVELYNGLDASDPDLKVDEYTKLFDEIALWEPGAVAYENLAVVNEGDLALKYQLTVNFTDATSTNDGKTLADVLKVAVVPGGFTGDREDAKALSYDYSLSTFAKVGKLLVNAAPDVYGIVIYWEPTANDNSYNMNAEGQDPLEITLGVNLLATQLASEEDSFNNQYDKDATYYDVVSDPAEVAPNATEAASVSTDDVSLNIPAALINNLPTEVETVRVAHSEPVIDSVNNKLIFDAFEVIDQDGNIIDLAALNNGEEITVKLFVGDVFADGIMISVYHDGEKIADAEVIGGYATYTATHFCTLEIALSASVDKWDGTADTSWYDPENPQTEYTFTTAEQVKGLSELCSGDTTFAGVTFTLANDLDLYCEDTSASADGDPVTFRPIGDHSKNGTFEGTFDGAGHTISNLYQNGWDLGYQWGAYGSYGLFGNVNDATIRNLTISGSESYIEGGDTSFVAGSATGTCVFENITITDSVSATYNNGNGGIIGWSGAGNYTFKNITIAEDCVLAGLWGSFDSSIGGVVGQAEPGATYNFENVEVNCRIDAYNDCTASYDYYNYRMCGMLIGRLEETTTINGTNYPDTSKYNITCINVTVNYGDWMNYHYCDPTPGLNGGRGMRVEPGYSYDGLPEDYDHTQCTTHHNELIPFDQIFGGDQLGVKGLKAYNGVTVTYPNN